jgi:hypothetical protein
VQLVERALGVPDAITDPVHRRRAACFHLADRAKVSLRAQADFDQSEQFLALAAVLKSVTARLDAGHLDGLIGDYGFDDIDELATRTAKTVQSYPGDWETLLQTTHALLESLRDYVRAHPFTDENGRPFK